MSMGVVNIFVLIPFLVLGLVAPVLGVVAFWKICTKAGFPPQLSLFTLLPLANIRLPLYIAFGQWHLEEDRIQ